MQAHQIPYLSYLTLPYLTLSYKSKMTKMAPNKTLRSVLSTVLVGSVSLNNKVRQPIGLRKK